MRRHAAGILLSLAAAAPGAEAPLPLRDALRQALAHNLGLGIQRLQAADAVDNLELADSAFDLRFRWSNTLGKARTLDEIRAGAFARDAWSSGVALEQPLAWGGTLALTGQADRFWEDSNGVAGDRLVQVGAGISYTQPLLRGGWSTVNLAPVVTARLGAGRSRLLLRSAVLDLLRDTEVGYWGLAASRSLVALRETSLRSAQSLLEEVSERRRLGAATVQEQLQAEADVANQRVAVLNARQQADLADTRLRRVLGRDEAGAAELGVEAIPGEAAPGIDDYRAWLGRVLDFDLAARAQRLQVEAADVRVDAARANDLPRLDLALSGALAGETGVHGRLGHALSALPDERGWNTAATLTLSFPLGFRDSEAQLRLARRARRAADLQLAEIRQALTFDARAVWRDLESSRARLAAAAAALDLQRRVYEGERARYSAGASDIPRVLQAQAALDGAQLSWVSALLDTRAASARAGRLDGSLLARHGFSWEDAEPLVGSGLSADDPLPALSAP
jgi:outer membrane protein TolC